MREARRVRRAFDCALVPTTIPPIPVSTLVGRSRISLNLTSASARRRCRVRSLIVNLSATCAIVTDRRRFPAAPPRLQPRPPGEGPRDRPDGEPHRRRSRTGPDSPSVSVVRVVQSPTPSGWSGTKTDRAPEMPPMGFDDSGADKRLDPLRARLRPKTARIRDTIDEHASSHRNGTRSGWGLRSLNETHPPPPHQGVTAADTYRHRSRRHRPQGPREDSRRLPM